jgi:hypothetical protein
MRPFAILIAATIISMNALAAFADSASTLPWELKRLLPCLQLDRQATSDCPVEVFDSAADDPADRVRSWRMPMEELTRSVLTVDESALGDALQTSEKSGVVFRCTSSDGSSRKCMVLHQAPTNKGGKRETTSKLPLEVNFVYFSPPYSDEAKEFREQTALVGPYTYCAAIRKGGEDTCAETSKTVDDYWKRWINLAAADDQLKKKADKLFHEILQPKKPCTSGGASEAIDILAGIHHRDTNICHYKTLLVYGDGLGIIADCARRGIGQNIGPPLKDSCRGLVAFDKKEIWVPAIVMAALSDFTGCIRDLIGTCAFQMGFSLDDGQDNLEKNASLTKSIIHEIIKNFGLPPWDLRYISFDDNLFKYTAVSTKRRSKIINEFEDLSLFISISGGDRSNLEILSDKTSDFLVTPSSESNKPLRIVLEVETYVSKYNSDDNTYWIKPSAEQVENYRAALSHVFSTAVAAACTNNNLKATINDATHAKCS